MIWLAAVDQHEPVADAEIGADARGLIACGLIGGAQRHGINSGWTIAERDEHLSIWRQIVQQADQFTNGRHYGSPI